MLQTDFRVANGPKRAGTDDSRARGEGDWTCLQCGNVNFAFRTTCNLRECATPKPTDGGQRGGGGPLGPAVYDQAPAPMYMGGPGAPSPLSFGLLSSYGAPMIMAQQPTVTVPCDYGASMNNPQSYQQMPRPTSYAPPGTVLGGGSLSAEQSSQLLAERIRNVDARGPSSPGPLAFGLGRPVSELLSPAFLAMFGDGRLWSSTIWDHCLEELNAQNDGCQPATSVEDLLSAFRPILAESVILQIQSTLEALKESSLGAETALVPSKESILRNVLSTLQECAREPVESDREPIESDREEWQQVQRRRSLNQNVPLRGRRIGGRGSRHGSRQGGQGGGDDGDDGEALEEDRVNGEFFQVVERIIVNLCDYRTPPKGNEVQSCVRALSIAERGRYFSLHFDARGDQILYNPYDTLGTACFYHGTRLSASHGFSRCGVQPFKPGTEFSPAPAFYVTNHVTAAFEFPLHNHLGKDPNDTVVVFQFDLNLEVLHGDIPPPTGDRRFKVRWFESGVERDTWEAFCKHNMYSEKPRHQHPFDIVIGAMCIPNAHARTVVPRHADLLQVGCCTKAAWKWVGSCVKRMYIESRQGV